jgi:hypothetical protein
MIWFVAGVSLGTCLGVVVASLCFAAASRRRRPNVLPRRGLGGGSRTQRSVQARV